MEISLRWLARQIRAAWNKAKGRAPQKEATAHTKTARTAEASGPGNGLPGPAKAGAQGGGEEDHLAQVRGDGSQEGKGVHFINSTPPHSTTAVKLGVEHPGGAILSKKSELEEIAHTGGKVIFHINIDALGRLSYSVEYCHSRPTPAAMFAIYAIPEGVAVGDIELGGIGQPWNPPPLSNCFPVFI